MWQQYRTIQVLEKCHLISMYQLHAAQQHEDKHMLYKLIHPLLSNSSILYKESIELKGHSAAVCTHIQGKVAVVTKYHGK